MRQYLQFYESKRLLLITLTIFGFSCVQQKQVAVKKKVESAVVVKKTDANKLLAVAAKKDRKYEQGAIDTVIKRNIEEKLYKYTRQQDSFSIAIAFLERASKDKFLYKNNPELVKLQLKVLKSFKDGFDARVKRIAMIDTSLDWTMLHEFNLAAFFGPGKYEIPADKLQAAERAFTPILDSLVLFYNRFTDINREATLIIRGFADQRSRYRSLFAKTNYRG